ncbi:PREDICTED: transcription initiation factor TFIID subunit 4B [Gekko japonicus]|uniref:Transcription initiation factor TFIID subunit 4B n=1 Tax=Gekko japonicus TaxID=146911 RepID=A0ABM1LBE1_GEKJA|nr:PREDICTED: transcription initiation factor TFIID subunit 4B [Gekko japonicus]
MHDHVFFAKRSVAAAGSLHGLSAVAACALRTLLQLPHRQPLSLRRASGNSWRLLCCGYTWALLEALERCFSAQFVSSMSIPPPAVPAALEKGTPSGPPEHIALAAGSPVNGASGVQEAPAVFHVQTCVASVPCPVTTMGRVAVAMNPASRKVPFSLVPSVSQQPGVLSAPGGTLVAKAAPVVPVQELSKPSSVATTLVSSAGAKAPPTTTVQLPANFQFPQGTVLLRSNTGQLMLVSQQAPVQAQGQAPNNTSLRQSLPANAPIVKIRTVQNPGTQVLKVLAAPVKTVPRTTPLTSTVKKPAGIESSPASGSSTATVSAVKTFAGPQTKSASDRPAFSVPQKPAPDKEGSIVTQTSTSAVTEAPEQGPLKMTMKDGYVYMEEMLENVKKCKNFLATLIKLASSGPQAPEMRQNVKNLVQGLLEGKIEPEEFTKNLYIELKSSPQPCLVPFLKKSMLALRQLMPNTQSFIQQCLQQSSTQTAVSACGTVAVTTPSMVAPGTPLNTASLQSARPAPRTPVGIPSPRISNSVPCTPLVTRGSGSFQFVHPMQTSSGVLQAANPVPPSPLTTGIVTKTVHLPHSIAMATGTTSLQAIKPVLASTVSSPALPALNAVKSVLSSAAAVTTSLQVVKQALTTAVVTSTTAVTTSLQSVIPITGTPITIRLAHPNSVHSQSARNSQAIKVKQLILQQPSGSAVKKVTTFQQTSTVPVSNRSGEKMSLNALIQANQLPAGSIVKQITLPGNQILSLQASPVQRNKIKENGTTSFRDEDDINDVTFMAGVNLSEESACILATNSDAVGTLIQSCPEEQLLSADVLKMKVLETGKRHDIMEVNSDVLSLISHATQERLRGLLEKLAIIAQHRMMTYKDNNKYAMSGDTRTQLRFLEKLDHMEKERKDEEQREMLLRAAKSRSNKEDPEQLRLKQKAKEMQELELAQMQKREANLAALAAIGPRKKRPLDSSSPTSGVEGLRRSPNCARPYLRPRITRICLRDLIFCMEQEKMMKHSLALYQALLK